MAIGADDLTPGDLREDATLSPTSIDRVCEVELFLPLLVVEIEARDPAFATRAAEWSLQGVKPFSHLPLALSHPAFDPLSMGSVMTATGCAKPLSVGVNPGLGRHKYPGQELHLKPLVRSEM
jgi:hypothetical protein